MLFEELYNLWIWTIDWMDKVHGPLLHLHLICVTLQNLLILILSSLFFQKVSEP